MLGIEIALIDGAVLRIGARNGDAQRHDLLEIVGGSEGLLGIVTGATVRLLPKPQEVTATPIGFDGVDDAAQCVGRRPDVIATGNIGCAVQIAVELSIPVVHTVELLDWAYGGPAPSALAKQFENRRQIDKPMVPAF